MTTTSEMRASGIHIKLAEFRKRCPSINKDTEAKIGNKYSYQYAKLPDIVNLINPLMEEMSIFYHWTCDGNRLSVTVVDLDSGGTVTSTILLSDKEVDFSEFQEVGKQLTYYSRYLLLLILGLVAQEDGAEINDVPQRRTKTTKKRRPPAVQEDDEDADEYEDDEDEDEDEDDEEEPAPRRSSRRMQRRGLPRRGR